jgi:phosphinothricin acetyltransferase
MIRNVELRDAEAICNIYNYYVENTAVTFEEVPVTSDEMRTRIKKVLQTNNWIVYEIEGKVVGYAYATEWRTRSAYRFSVECTVYLDKNYRSKNIGTQLYIDLIELLKKKGRHTIIAVITLPNNKSIAVHEKLGFRKVAHFEEVGYKFDKWIDVGFWQYNFK